MNLTGTESSGTASGAYYNEFDPEAAQWLRNLIKNGLIADGDVDERSITLVRPSDLRGYAQHHFFAGLGGWSFALRLAGWEDSRPIWTASCPCQPFSGTGQGSGFADERHMWPAVNHLVKECRPSVIAGEQVASKDAEPWLDLVHTDLEALDYAFGSIAFPAASVGAPHIRDRTYWMGYTDNPGLEGHGRHVDGREKPGRHFSGPGRSAAAAGVPVPELPGPTNGFWRDADWLTDGSGQWRAVRPGTFPLADGPASRVVRLRAYGNAVNVEAARAWIEVMMETLKELA